MMPGARFLTLLAVALSSAACGREDAARAEGGSDDSGVTTLSGDSGVAATSGAPTTYVLVHGGWHGAWAWDATASLLEAEGDVAITPTLPAHGSDPTTPAQATLDAYVQAVVAAIDATDERVVLVGHSMAGAIVSMAAEARPARVRLLVYLAAVLLEDGKSVTSVTGSDSESVLGQHPVFNSDGTLSIDASFAHESLYGDCSQADADAAIARLRNEPIAPLVTPIHVTEGAWGSVPRIYVHTLDDKAIGPSAQEAMYTTLPCQSIVTMQTSHSPFYCDAPDFVSRLREAVASNGT